MNNPIKTIGIIVLLAIIVLPLAACGGGSGGDSSGGGGNRNSIVGTWETEGGNARYVFKADGTGTYEEGVHGIYPIAYTVETFTHEGVSFYQIYHGESDGGNEIISPYGTINYEGGDEFSFGGVFKRK